MGIKRKISDREIEEEGDGCQRESILSLSMDKLSSKTIRKVEPPLLRSVLILNTLKYIANDLHANGIQYVPTTDPAMVISDVNVDQLAFDSLPQYVTGLPSSDSDSPLPHIPPGMPKGENHACPLPPIESFVCSPGLKDNSVSSSVFDWLNQAEKAQLDCILTNEIMSPASSIPVKMEDIFNDIDQTFDIFTSIASSLKLTPLSADQVNGSSHSMASETLTPLLNSPLSCKSDSMRDDLDNIMQILVGT